MVSTRLLTLACKKINIRQYLAFTFKNKVKHLSSKHLPCGS